MTSKLSSRVSGAKPSLQTWPLDLVGLQSALGGRRQCLRNQTLGSPIGDRCGNDGIAIALTQLSKTVR